MASVKQVDLEVVSVKQVFMLTWRIGEHPGEPNHQKLSQKYSDTNGGAYCDTNEGGYRDTNERSTQSISSSSRLRGTKGAAKQMGGVLPLLLKVVVGGSDNLLKN